MACGRHKLAQSLSKFAKTPHDRGNGGFAMKIAPIAVLAGTLVLASCGLTEKQCAQGDWAGIGLKDGKNGRSADYIQTHMKSCAKHGIDVEQPIWEQGRQEGLKTYCTPASAYIEGRNGKGLKSVCPDAELEALKAAHAKGEHYYDIQQEIRSLFYERDQLLSEISNLRRGAQSPDTLLAIQSRQLEISRIDFDINMLDLEAARYSRL